MTGIQALRGLPKDLRAKVISCIIKYPFERSRKLHKYLASDLNELLEICGHRRYVNKPSTLFALGLSWSESDYFFWKNKFEELEGVNW